MQELVIFPQLVGLPGLQGGSTSAARAPGNGAQAGLDPQAGWGGPASATASAASIAALAFAALLEALAGQATGGQAAGGQAAGGQAAGGQAASGVNMLPGSSAEEKAPQTGPGEEQEVDPALQSELHLLLQVAALAAAGQARQASVALAGEAGQPTQANPASLPEPAHVMAGEVPPVGLENTGQAAPGGAARPAAGEPAVFPAVPDQGQPAPAPAAEPLQGAVQAGKTASPETGEPAARIAAHPAAPAVLDAPSVPPAPPAPIPSSPASAGATASLAPAAAGASGAEQLPATEPGAQPQSGQEANLKQPPESGLVLSGQARGQAAGDKVRPVEEERQNDVALNRPDAGRSATLADLPAAAETHFARAAAPHSLKIEPDRLAGARTADLVGQVSQAVAHLSKGEITSLRLQLHPAELGQIDLSISAEDEGARVVIVAELPRTGQLLERHLDDLRQSLQQAGVSLSGLTVGQDGGQGGLAGWPAETHPEAHGVRAPKVQAKPEDQPSRGDRLSAGAAGAVDYRI
jgi:flagellar hook-length control protein FliK